VIKGEFVFSQKKHILMEIFVENLTGIIVETVVSIRFIG
jgi:CRISPR/Cas system-associated endonuclease Cas1